MASVKVEPTEECSGIGWEVGLRPRAVLRNLSPAELYEKVGHLDCWMWLHCLKRGCLYREVVQGGFVDGESGRLQ